jgi:hypothetical protein
MLSKSISLNIKHGSYVAKIVTDDRGNVYTAGGDGVVYQFHIDALVYALLNKTVAHTVEKTSVYGKISQK